MFQSESEFARHTWGNVDLGDRRLTARAVRVGGCMTAYSDASLATQMKDPAGLEGAYRLMNHANVTLEALLAPTYAQTIQLANLEKVVLWVNDGTELDYTFQRKKTGLGPIGDGKGRGLLMHSTLAIEPDTRQVLGLGNVQVYLREPTPKPDPKWTRSMEGRVWEVAASAIGPPAEGVIWVEVSDAGSDSFRYMTACVREKKHFLIRVVHNRWMSAKEDGQTHKLIDYARSLPMQEGSETEVEVKASKNQPARMARVVMGWAALTLPPSFQAPKEERLLPPVEAWVLRIFEPNPPNSGEELEWILLSSLPVTTLSEARTRVDWYRCRWFCEDFHQCLKTGCHIEHSQLSDRADVEALLGFAAPIAVRLLQLRQVTRLETDHLAREEVDPLMVEVLAQRVEVESQTMSIKTFWKLVARLGGFQGRKGDHDPGWRTLWWGWRYLSDLTEGARMMAKHRTKL